MQQLSVRFAHWPAAQRGICCVQSDLQVCLGLSLHMRVDGVTGLAGVGPAVGLALRLSGVGLLVGAAVRLPGVGCCVLPAGLHTLKHGMAQHSPPFVLA